MQNCCNHEAGKQTGYLFLSLVFLSISCVCVVLQSESRLGYALWTLPAAFTFFYLLTGGRLSTRENPCLVVLYVVMAIRYVLVPLSCYATDPQWAATQSGDSMNQAILLSVWEMICVFFTIFCCRHSKAFISEIKHERFEEQATRISDWSVGIVVFASVTVLCLHPSLLGTSDILWGKVDSDLLKINTGISGAFSMLWGVGRSFIYLGLFHMAVRRYKKSGNYRFVLAAVLLTLCFTALIYTGGIRVARWGMVIAFLSSFSLLSDYFPEHRNSVRRLVLLPSAMLLMAATFYKNLSSRAGSGANHLAAFQGLFNFDLLNAYFGGFKNVYYALVMYHSFHSSIFNLSSDCLKNMPYVSNFIDPAHTTTFLFNRAVYGFFPANDRIVPMVGQGLSYFGAFFSPLLSVFAVICLFYSNALSRKSANLYLKYIYLYTGYFFSVFMCLNLSILLSVLYSTVIPFFFFMLWNRIQFTPKDVNVQQQVQQNPFRQESVKP